MSPAPWRGFFCTAGDLRSGSAGAIALLALAHIGDTVPYEARQATIGQFLAATMMGQIVGGSLAGMFAEFFGWRLAFIAFGIAGIAVALIAAALYGRVATRTLRH